MPFRSPRAVRLTKGGQRALRSARTAKLTLVVGDKRVVVTVGR